MSKETPLLENVTGNATFGPFNMKGTHVIAVHGVMGGATLNFFHRYPNSSSPDASQNLPQDPDLTFTTVPAPFPLECAVGLPLFVQVTNAGVSTNLKAKAFLIEDYD